MSDDLILWCWVLGDPEERVFPVIIKRSYPIGLLKLAILEQKPFENVDADSLSLYKFQLPLKGFNEQSIDLANGDKLESTEDVSFHWVEAPGKVLSIILPRPLGTTITPSSSENSDLNSLPFWLVEIHRELWGNRNFLGKIFRTATVDMADFTELQSLLDAQNPGRHSDEYVSQDVFATKLAFLHSKSTATDSPPKFVGGLVPRLGLVVSQPPSPVAVDEGGVVGDDGVVDDDDDDVVGNDDVVMGKDEAMDDNAAIHFAHFPNEATALFPYNIQYVDLTVLRWQGMLRVPRLMLFRNEWGHMIDIFNDREKGMKGSAVFSANELGKTCMLYSILILCIILARPIVFQDVHGKVFIIDDTVRPLGTSGVPVGGDDVLTLVDADHEVCEPSVELFQHGECRILLTSSPKNNDHRKWLKQFVGEHAMFMMKPWSREELVIASLFLHSKDITLKQFQEASRICGHVPRECFTAALSPLALSLAKETIRKDIKETSDLSDTFNKMSAGGEMVIHRVFQIRPSHEHRVWIHCFVEPVSDWAFKRIMDELRTRRAGAAYEFYRAVKGCKESAPLAGKSFEYHVHDFLTTSSQSFPISCLDGPSPDLTIQFTSDTKHFGDNKWFSSDLILSVASATPCYLQPLSPVFPSFDSFLYQPGMSESRFSHLIALQVTVASTHTIKSKGLEDYQSTLNDIRASLNPSSLTLLRPTIKRKMVILFVIPKTSQPIFKKQSIEPFWDARTIQYILALDEEDVFNARSS